MNKLIAFLSLAFIPAFSPITGQAQSVSELHRSHFSIGKLSTRETKRYTYVDGEITSNAAKEAGSVWIAVRWFDKSDKVVAKDSTYVSDLAPGETLPFHAYTEKNPEIKRYDVTIERVH